MSRKSIKERAKELTDNLSTDKAKLILNLIERFNEKEEEAATKGGEHAQTRLGILGKLNSQDITYF